MTDSEPRIPRYIDPSEQALAEGEPELWNARPDYVTDHARWADWMARVRCQRGDRTCFYLRVPHERLCVTCKAEGASTERPQKPEPQDRRAHVPGTLGEALATFADVIPALDPALLEPASPSPSPSEQPSLPKPPETGAGPASRGTPLSRTRAKLPAKVDARKLFGEHAAPGAEVRVRPVDDPATHSDECMCPRCAPMLDVDALDALEAQLAAPAGPVHAIDCDLDDDCSCGVEGLPAASLRGPGLPGQSFDLGDVHVETTLHGPGARLGGGSRTDPRGSQTELPGSIPDPPRPARRRASSLDSLGPRKLRPDELLAGTVQLSNKGCPRYYASDPADVTCAKCRKALGLPALVT